jgi:cyclophilin family peptidyl-prolyl cis-trans isomerase
MDLRVLFPLLLIPAVSGPAQEPTAPTAPSDLEAVVTTDLGSFRFEFAPDKAPKHVEHFIGLARQGYYDGSAFHWAKPGVAVQGGDPLLKDPSTPRERWGSGGLGQVPTELSDLKHRRGVVSSMRIVSRPDSDGAQFFVCLTQQPGMDGKYSAFGRITEGMDTVDKISRVRTDEKGYTEQPVRITSIRIEKRKPAPFVNASRSEMRKTVTMTTTLGTMKLKMEPDWAPNHVRNFLNLVSAGWYDGTEFHRVVKGFVAQGGIGLTRSTGPDHPADRWVHTLTAEFSGIRHVRGSLSMARADDPNSASTSFFLVLGPSPILDGKYSIFGHVTEGLDVLDSFAKEKLIGERPRRRIEVIEARIDPD